MADCPDLELYRVGNVAPQERRQRCVARQHIINDVLRYLKNSPTRKSKHNFLFLGAEGIGKTFLLSRIEDECRESGLRDIVTVARFPEESYSTISFADFLRKLVQLLDQDTGDSVWKTVLNTQEKRDDFSNLAVEAIREYSNKTGKTIVVMLENVDQILSDQFRNREDVAALRKFLMGENGCTLIATARGSFGDASSVDRPLYDFFDTQRLQPFTREEAIELLLAIRQTREHPLDDFSDQKPLLLAFYDICDGNPRWLSVVCLCLLNGIRNSDQILNELMNQATDEFQEVLESVSPQEAAALSKLAHMRSLGNLPRTPNRIANVLGFSQQHTSSLLKRLAEQGLVASMTSSVDKRSREFRFINQMLADWLVFTDQKHRVGMQGTLKSLVKFYSATEVEDQIQAKISQQLESESLQNIVTRQQLLKALTSWRDQWRIDRSGPFVDETEFTQLSKKNWTSITATVLLTIEKRDELNESHQKNTVEQFLNRASLLLWSGHKDEAIAQLDAILVHPATTEPEYDFCFTCLSELLEDSKLMASGKEMVCGSVFLSYKWGNQQRHNQARNGFVRYLQLLLRRAGIEVLRDETHISSGGSIEAHADRILDVPCMIAVISPDYLKSKYCMVDELFKLYQKCGKKRERFQQCLVPILIRKAEEMLVNSQDILKFWQSEAERLGCHIAGISAHDRKLAEEIRHMTEHLPDMLNTINDVVLPRGYSAVLGVNFTTILRAVEHRLRIDGSEPSREFETLLKGVANESCEQIVRRIEIAVLTQASSTYVIEFEAGNRWLKNMAKFASSLARKRMNLYLAYLVNNDDYFRRISGANVDLAKRYLEQSRLEQDQSCRSTEALSVSLSHTLGSASIQELAGFDHVIAKANYLWTLLRGNQHGEAIAFVASNTLAGRIAECAALLFAEIGQLDKMHQAIDVLKQEAESGGEIEQLRYSRSVVLAGQAFLNKSIASSENPYTISDPLSQVARHQLDQIKKLIEPTVRRAEEQPRVARGIDLLACELAFRMAIVEGDIQRSKQMARTLAKSEPISQYVGVAMSKRFIEPNIQLCQKLKDDWGHKTEVQIEVLAILTLECSAEKAAVDQLAELLNTSLSDEEKAKLSTVVLLLATSESHDVRNRAYAALVQLCGTEHHFLRMAEAKWELDAGNAEKALVLLHDRPKPDDPDWLSMRAWTLQQLGREPEALEDLQQLCELTRHSNALWRAAELARKLGRRDYVIATLKRLKVEPQQRAKATEYLAHELVKEGSDESLAEAAELFQELSQGEQNRPELLQNAANCYVQLRRYEDSLAIINQLHKFHTGYPQAYLLHATVLEIWQKPDDAFSVLHNPDVKSKFWCNKAFLLKYMELGYKTNHELEAHQAMTRIAELERDLPESARLLKSADLDTLVKLLTSRNRFHDELNQWILQGRIPWTAPAFESGRPFYAAWRYRTQECDPHINTSGRAQLHTYTTNGFHVIERNHGIDLEPLQAPGEGTEVVADISALITWHEMGILKEILHFFKQVHVPAIYREIEVNDYRGLQPHQLSKVDIARKLNSYFGDNRFTTNQTIPQDCLRVGRVYENDCNLLVGDFAKWLEANEVIDSEKLESIPANEFSPYPPDPQTNGSRELAVVITHDALELLESCDILGPVTKSKRCRVLISQETTQEVRANHQAYENQGGLLRDCDEFWAAIRSFDRIHFVNPEKDLSEVESAEVEDTNSIRRALAAYDLAKVRKIPLIADDRVLISVRLNESSGNRVAACSTAELIGRLCESNVIRKQQRLQLKMQLIRWRYRNVLFDEMDLVELAKKVQTTGHAPHGLQEVARYVQDCMLDFGQFGGDEPVEPVRSIAAQLYMHWTKVTARFVNQLWTGNLFSNPQAETLTRWAVDCLLPCNAKSMRPDLQVNFATSQYKLFLVHLLNQRALVGDRSRSAELMRVLREHLPLRDSEFWMPVFELIKAEPGSAPELIDEEAWTTANQAMRRNIAKHALAQFADEEGGFQLDSRGYALMEASHSFRRPVALPAPDQRLIESLNSLDRQHALQQKCNGPLFFFVDTEKKESINVLKLTEPLMYPHAEMRKGAVERLRIVAANHSEALSPRIARLLVQQGRKVCQKRAINWYPVAEELLNEIDNDWLFNLSGFRQCLQDSGGLGEFKDEFWSRCIVPQRHPAASAPASAFSLITNAEELDRLLNRIRLSNSGMQQKTREYLNHFSHLPLSSTHSLAVLAPKSADRYREFVRELISIASSDDYLQAFHGCLALIALWDNLKEDEQTEACRCLSNFILLSMKQDQTQDWPENEGQRYWHCLRAFALHFMHWIPLHGPEFGEDNSTSLAWWLAGRLTNAVMEHVNLSGDRNKRYKVLWDRIIVPSYEFSFQNNKYIRHGSVSTTFAILSMREPTGGPFLAELLLSMQDNLEAIFSRLSSDVVGAIQRWCLVSSVVSSFGQRHQKSVVLQNYENCIRDLQSKCHVVLKELDQQSSSKSWLSILDGFADYKSFECPDKLEDNLLTIWEQGEEKGILWLQQLQVAASNRQLDTDALFRTLSDVEKQKQWLRKLTEDQITLLCSTLIQIQASSLYNPRYTVDMHSRFEQPAREFGGERWTFELPYLFINWLDQPSSDPACRQRLVHACIWSAIIGGVPLAIQQLLDRPDRSDYENVLNYHYDRIESLRKIIPHWAWSQIRWALGMLKSLS